MEDKARKRMEKNNKGRKKIKERKKECKKEA